MSKGSRKPSPRAAIDAEALLASARATREARNAERLARRTDGRRLFVDGAGNPVLRPAFVTYLDELGTTERLLNYDDAALREDIRLYDRMRDLLHNEEMYDDERQRALYFSDNVVVVEPIDPHPSVGADLGLFTQVFSAAVYQLNLAVNGRFLRGGIAGGMAYADGEFVTGPAHVCAVLLEEKEAVVPRVLLNDIAVGLAQRHVEDEAPAPSAFATYLLVDQDERVFVNYLPAVFEDEGFVHAPNPRDGLVAHRDQVIAMRARYPSGGVGEKYDWVAAYHNYVVTNSRVDNRSELYIPEAPTLTFTPFA
ncbi:hypothetical protein [Nocardioides campestrisoli]|uniref:hypothetical protein n=1 Tax=Nocardioides campestrisoli TaxID=2736757 RepID=UPI00163DB796|nr:hypothetical protein [Nocardioides campestrisoli]